MIAAPKPGTDAYRVLALVVAHPGELDAEAIGQRTWRPKLTRTEDYLRVRASIATSGPEWARRASTCLADLTRRGLVEPRRRPMLSETIPAPPSDDQPRSVTLAWAADTLTVSEHPFAADSVNAISLLANLVMFRPHSVAYWAGTSGASKRAVSALYEAGIVVPPSFRWPTAAGAALVEGPALRGDATGSLGDLP